MPSRIDVELTSARDDGTWTWRAAGAREPKGVIDASLLPPGAKVGDVVRAEASFELDGIWIEAVLPPKTKARKEPQRLEVLGPERETKPVTSSLAGGTRRSERDRAGSADGRPRGRRRAADSRPSRDTERRHDERGEDGRRRRAARADKPGGRARHRDGGTNDSRSRSDARSRRLVPRNTHRSEVMASLYPEQRPVAEQLLRGGLPAVRQAIAEQNREAERAGRPLVQPDALLALAEELLPRLKKATWLDRAEAAAEAPEEISLRDLRSVVAGSEAVTRDDGSRALAGRLKEVLDRRTAVARQEWIESISSALDEGRLVRALHLSSRSPDPGSRIPADLAVRLRDAASSALSPDASPVDWSNLLEAVAASPVRRVVRPAGLPAGADRELLVKAHAASGQVPALAPLLGIHMPPPPGPPKRPSRKNGAGKTVDKAADKAQVPSSR